MHTRRAADLPVIQRVELQGTFMRRRCVLIGFRILWVATILLALAGERGPWWVAVAVGQWLVGLAWSLSRWRCPHCDRRFSARYASLRACPVCGLTLYVPDR